MHQLLEDKAGKWKNIKQEAVKLIESGRHKIVDQVWFVIADPLIQKERMIQYRGHSAAEADARLQAQPPIEARLPFVHVIIKNNGTMDELIEQVQTAWQGLLSDKKKEA